MSTPDISQLSEAQQTALQTYTSVTDQDPLAAIPLLQRSEWNVQIAIARFFDGEPASDPVAEARAALPSTSSRHTSNLQYESLLSSSRSSPIPRHDPVARVSTPANGESQYHAPFLLSLLFTPFGFLYRLVAVLLSPFRFLVPTFVARLLARLTSTRRQRPYRRPLSPTENTRRFLREFSEEYGPNNLPFAEDGFNTCLDSAKRDLKFFLVVLLSPSHDDTSTWVRDTLLSNQLGGFLASRKDEIVMWGGNVQDAEAYQVADALQCTKFPFVALVCQTSESGSTGMSTVLRATGPMAVSELVAKLGSAMTSQEVQLTATRAQRREQQASRNLRQEQDSAYERSLAQDRERARQKREEQEAQARAEKEALAKVEQEEKRKRDLEQWKRWRAQSLPPEPDGSSSASNPKDGGIIRMSIRLPSGERVLRRFRTDAALEELYAFVECFDYVTTAPTEDTVEEPNGFDHQYAFRLVSPMPRTVFDVEKGGSIGQRIGRAGNLIVEPIVADEDEDEEDEEEEMDMGVRA